MRALVTGANGFVGRHLVAHLRSHGDDVVAWDHTTGGPDITDGAELATRLAGEHPEALYHLAGWSDVGGSWQAPREAFRANAEGTLNVLLAAVEAGVQRVLVVSSADVYGIVEERELPLTEDSPLRPVSPYAASKVAADLLGLQAYLGHRLGVIRVRAFNHLGPGQTERFVAPALAARIARAEAGGDRVIAVGNLEARRDFTDVRDVVEAYRRLVADGRPGEVYNVCSGHDLAVADLAHRLVALARVPVELRHDPALERPIDTPVLRGDNSKIHAATGWEPSIPIDRTIGDVLDDWRRRVSSETTAAP
jgi:GDP-4-dehydro-6-deoxy-D-mannose reductase